MQELFITQVSSQLVPEIDRAIAFFSIYNYLSGFLKTDPFFLDIEPEKHTYTIQGIGQYKEMINVNG